MPQLKDPSKKREIKIHYPAELYDQLVEGLAFRFGWNEQGVPANTAGAKAHATYNAQTQQWKPSKQEFSMEMAVSLIWQQAMEGVAARQAQAAQQATQQAFAAAMTEAASGGHLVVQSGEV